MIYSAYDFHTFLPSTGIRWKNCVCQLPGSLTSTLAFLFLFFIWAACWDCRISASVRHYPTAQSLAVDPNAIHPNVIHTLLWIHISVYPLVYRCVCVDTAEVAIYRMQFVISNCITVSITFILFCTNCRGCRDWWLSRNWNQCSKC